MRTLLFLLLLSQSWLLMGQNSRGKSFSLPEPLFEDVPDTLNFNNGKRYIGALKEGSLQGWGLLLNPEGDTLYIGEFQDSKKHGQGRYFFAAGNVYSGEWRDNRMHGFGEMKFYTGDRYVGRWFDDRFHGQGTYYFADGSKYEGEFFEGKRHGAGRLESKEQIYDGNWANGFKEGQGKETTLFPNYQEVYEGSFRQGQYEGRGLWRVIREDRVTTEYEGTFVAGERRGKGVYRMGGRELYGTWPANEATTTEGKSISERGSYEGGLLKGFFHGQGRMLYADGSRYEGQWVRGKRQGQGKMVWADGQVYEGAWLMDQPHGQGIMYLANGKVREGTFARGEFVKK